jgi:hypothetical protein
VAFLPNESGIAINILAGRFILNEQMDTFFLAVNNPVKAQSSATHSEELRYTITEKFTASIFS